MRDWPMSLAVGDCWGSPGIKLASARSLVGVGGASEEVCHLPVTHYSGGRRSSPSVGWGCQTRVESKNRNSLGSSGRGAEFWWLESPLLSRLLLTLCLFGSGYLQSTSLLSSLLRGRLRSADLRFVTARELKVGWQLEGSERALGAVFMHVLVTHLTFPGSLLDWSPVPSLLDQNFPGLCCGFPA